MKALFYTLIVCAAAFAAYDYFLEAPWERVVFDRGPKPMASPSANDLSPIPHEIEDDGPMPAATTTKAADDYNPSVPKLASGDFVPPTLESLEDLTKNWTCLPAHAFPRMVKLREPAEVSLSVGSSRLPAGATAFALACSNGNLTIAPTETSAARGLVAVIKTDIQDQLLKSYETWKAGRIEAARKAWLAKKTAVPSPHAVINEPVISAGAVDSVGKPVQSPDGSYPLLLASMRSGQVTEITPSKVKSWGRVETKDVNGQPTWIVDVSYDTVVFCGAITAKAQAQVRNGKVVAWRYPSGEEVP